MRSVQCMNDSDSLINHLLPPPTGVMKKHTERVTGK